VSRLGELTRKVDAFFARVADRHGEAMQCTTGCSDCCHVRLTITGVEALTIRDHVAGWPIDRRRDLAAIGPSDRPSVIAGRGAGAAGGAGDLPRQAGDLPRELDRCAALDPAGRCKIYEARPLVCRSHGVPVRLQQGALPVVQACHRNFTHTTPDPDCILDQATLSAMLYAIDAAEARGGASGGRAHEPGDRVELAGLLADLAAI
jgi:Fe-S-cluster containining protein